MDNHKNLQLKNQDETPTNEILEQVLGNSYSAYEALQDVLPNLEMAQEWQWYKPHKAWFARGQHWWITSRGTNKEKTLYWLHVYDGYFCVVVWFLEKNRAEALRANISDKAKQVIRDAKTFGKLATFPVGLEITNINQLNDVYALIDCKKRVEKK